MASVVAPPAARPDWRLETNAALWTGAAGGVYLYMGLLECGFLNKISGNIWVLALIESPFVLTAAVRGPAGCAPAQWSAYSSSGRAFTLSAALLLFVAFITFITGVAETTGTPGSVAAYLVPSAMFTFFAIIMCYGGQRRPAGGMAVPIAQPVFYPPTPQYAQQPLYFQQAPAYGYPQQKLLL